MNPKFVQFVWIDKPNEVLASFGGEPPLIGDLVTIDNAAAHCTQATVMYRDMVVQENQHTGWVVGLRA